MDHHGQCNASTCWALMSWLQRLGEPPLVLKEAHVSSLPNLLHLGGIPQGHKCGKISKILV